MKQICCLLVVAALAALVIVSCKKTATTETTGGIIHAEQLAKDESFAALNAAVDRFDPEYLRIVFKDTRSVEAIMEQSAGLMGRLKAAPDDQEALQQLALLYHFKNQEQMKACAEKIGSAMKVLNEKYAIPALLQSQSGQRMLYRARCLQAKAKIDAGGAEAKQPNGLWSDWVDGIVNEAHYALYVYDEGFAASTDVGGPCGESCCYEWQSCKVNAQTRYYTNIWLYAGGGAVSFGGVGAAAGSTVPFWGNIIGAAGGAIWGAAMGTITALNIYNNDLNACANNYLACLSKRK